MWCDESERRFPPFPFYPILKYSVWPIRRFLQLLTKSFHSRNGAHATRVSSLATSHVLQDLALTHGNTHEGTAVEPEDRVTVQLIVLLHRRSEARLNCAAVLWGPRKCGDRNVYTSRQSRQKARSTERTKKRYKNSRVKTFPLSFTNRHF